MDKFYGAIPARYSASASCQGRSGGSLVVRSCENAGRAAGRGYCSGEIGSTLTGVPASRKISRANVYHVQAPSLVRWYVPYGAWSFTTSYVARARSGA